ncbi:MAG TPA: transporter substrate-binding domain-containing protein [Devosiaceae bacterium]|jgi:polar amino acid transport system substrate-binding protein
MKLLSALIAAGALALGLATPAAAQQRLPDLHGRTIKAVTENAYVPLNFADPKTGQGVGLEYDLFNEIARRLNAGVDWQISSWDVMMQAVHDGQFDIGMDGITITPERSGQIDVSDSYLTSQQFMLVRADETRFADARSFAANPDLLIGAQAGTTNFYVAVNSVLDGNEANPRIKLFDTFGTSVQALKSGDVDTVLMDQSSANGFIGANPGAFKEVGNALGAESFGFILTPGSDLLDPVNAALATIVADGTLAKLTDKWFYQYNAAQ